MHNTLNQWLKELEVETQITYSTDINEEANSNLMTFGVDESLLNEWGKDSIESFIRECAELYKSKSTITPMIFYSWFDEMAGQIRMSAVSGSHGKLPFGCEINAVELSELIETINFDESDELTGSSTLNVWQLCIYA